MTYLRSVPSDLDHEAFQRPRYGALMPLAGLRLIASARQ
jgi:hypothetical protein